LCMGCCDTENRLFKHGIRGVWVEFCLKTFLFVWEIYFDSPVLGFASS
jgi:hypothetical protein